MSDGAFQPDWFSKPGDTIAELMSRRGLNAQTLATSLESTVPAIRGLLAGSVKIDTALAQRLAGCVGGSSAFWLKRQASYEAALSRASERVAKEAGAAWVRSFPTKDIAEYGWFRRPANRTEALKAYLAFFDVTSPDEWKERYSDLFANVAFRTSKTFDAQVGPVSAWLREGEMQAKFVKTKPWNPKELRKKIPELRKLTLLRSPSTFVPLLRAICASVGVAVVFARAPAGCRASGATRFVAADKAMILLSFRYLSEDHFWFTFFHELGHLILHGRDQTFVDGEGPSNAKAEKEADAFSAGVLVPLSSQEQLFQLHTTKTAVIRFAVSIGISPGIVVGQMQHLGLLGPAQLNFLKRRYAWGEIERAFA